jgi:DNA end-binding protein Ku
MPRALWTGSISFGLVNVPVRLYSATRDHDLHFHYVHEPDGSRIGYEKVCKAEGKPVPDDEIVKAFEWEKGEWVYMSDEDFEAVAVEGSRSIEITDFVPHDEIDPIFFEKTYYAGPEEGGERVYALLAKTLEKSGLVAIAKFVMRDRQHLACLRVRDGVITLERMHFADEVLPPDELAPKGVRVNAKELDMATQLVERFSGSWKPDSYDDTYREQLCDLIKAKRKGEEIHVEREPEEDEPADLMEALRASLESTGGSKQRRSTPSSSGGSRSRRGGTKRRAKSSSKR